MWRVPVLGHEYGPFYPEPEYDMGEHDEEQYGEHLNMDRKDLR